MENIESDESCCLKRFYANRRPACNLLQEGNFHSPIAEVTHEEMKRYLDHQIFYAFYPGVSTIGGEEKPGYENWKRYFRGNSQCDRDRALFKEAVPLIRRLNRAGWEPETGARCDRSGVFVERYGAAPGSDVLLAVRNPSPVAVTATLRLYPEVLGKAGTLAVIRAGSHAVAGPVPNSFALTLSPWETAVYCLHGSRAE